MCDFQWKQTQFEERRFNILACLLARKGPQPDSNSVFEFGTGSTSQSAEDDQSDEDEIDESATITPRKIAGTKGTKILLEKFLDRLAEVMAREIERDKKPGDVCATGLLEYKEHVTVFVAKNGGLNCDDTKMMRHLQIWLRAVSALGERRDIKTDEMWKKMVKWSQPRILYYRKTLASIFQDAGIIWPSSNTGSAIGRKLAAVRDFCLYEADLEGQWTQIITICYELRYEPAALRSYLQGCYTESGMLQPETMSSLCRWLAFLGRLRIA